MKCEERKLFARNHHYDHLRSAASSESSQFPLLLLTCLTLFARPFAPIFPFSSSLFCGPLCGHEPCCRGGSRGKWRWSSASSGKKRVEHRARAFLPPLKFLKLDNLHKLNDSRIHLERIIKPTLAKGAPIHPHYLELVRVFMLPQSSQLPQCDNKLEFIYRAVGYVVFSLRVIVLREWARKLKPICAASNTQLCKETLCYISCGTVVTFCTHFIGRQWPATWRLT